MTASAFALPPAQGFRLAALSGFTRRKSTSAFSTTNRKALSPPALGFRDASLAMRKKQHVATPRPVSSHGRRRTRWTFVRHVANNTRFLLEERVHLEVQKIGPDTVQLYRIETIGRSGKPMEKIEGKPIRSDEVEAYFNHFFREMPKQGYRQDTSASRDDISGSRGPKLKLMSESVRLRREIAQGLAAPHS